jgi:N-acyl-D-aspartate/D-glutamate deacylase
MFDLVIRGGAVVDGSGADRVLADVAVIDGRIAEIGDVEGKAKQVIDANDLIVAPGFVDVHTHYDAQVFWDRHLTPSSLYGVTTVMAGNCGFGLAPLTDTSGEYLMRMLARVEGMPLASLEAGVPWNWKSVDDYFDKVEDNLAVNMGFLIGHSTLRRYVMGEEANLRVATAAEVASMCELLRDALAAGGLGFSSSRGLAHFDAEGSPVPSRSADEAELLALAKVCGEFEGTSLEFMPGDIVGMTEEQVDLMVAMSSVAKRPLNWNLVRITEATAEATMGDLRAGTASAERGGKVIALTMPIPSRARFSFATGFVLDAIPGWAETMNLSSDQKLNALRDPSTRERLFNASDSAPRFLRELVDWGSKVLTETFSPAMKQFEGRVVSDIARERGTTPFDTLLDIVCDDNLLTTFSYLPKELTRGDWLVNVGLWEDGRAVIGGSDAGAHLDFTATFDYHAYVLEHAVRRHQALSLEAAVHHLCEVPAQLYGLQGRGTIKVGGHADVVIFDEEKIETGQIRTRFDLPGGAARLYSEPSGISYVIVNGEVAVQHGELTSATSGSVLRSGRDTTTPSL